MFIFPTLTDLIYNLDVAAAFAAANRIRAMRPSSDDASSLAGEELSLEAEKSRGQNTNGKRLLSVSYQRRSSSERPQYDGRLHSPSTKRLYRMYDIC